MIPTKTPLAFYWKMVDHFLGKPGSWRFLGTDWQVERDLPTSRHLVLKARVNAGPSYKTGKFTMAARVQVKGGNSVAFSRGALRELAAVGLLDRLQQHGFQWKDEPLAYYPLGAWKPVYPRTFADERRFLSDLAERSGGRAERQAPRSLRQWLDGFRGPSAGAWRPLYAQWELRKPIRIAGRPATAICMFHIAPADLEGRLGVASSITIWSPWNRKWPLPAWLSEYRARLDSQFRSAGHTAEWHKGPRGRGVMVTSMREDLQGLADVVRERRALEEADLGDPT